MSREHQQSAPLAPGAIHLDEARLQGLADGSLRGPEGLAAREHCEFCPGCAAEVEGYRALVATLDALRDPPPPADFTLQVLMAAEERERQLEARRHIRLAAIPAGIVAVVALVGWLFSAAPGQRIEQLVQSVTVLRGVYEMVGPVVLAARVPLALGAIASVAVIGFVLRGTLRRGREVTTR
jgi:anti-sigma factor RsiW